MAKSTDELAKAIAILERWRDTTSGTLDDRIDGSTLRAELLTSMLIPDDLLELNAAGCRVEIAIQQESWNLRLEAAPDNPFTVLTDDPLSDAFEGEQLRRAEIALRNSDWKTFLDLCADMQANVVLAMEHDPDAAGFHWVRKQHLLEEEFSGPRWSFVLERLFLTKGGQRVVAMDAVAGAHVYCQGLAIHAAEMIPPDVTDRARDDVETAYAAAFHSDGRAWVPSPLAVLPVARQDMDQVAQTLESLSEVLCWYWLATDITKAADGVSAVFRGARIAEVKLTVSSPRASTSPLALFKWAISTVDPDRRSATEQAISLAVHHAEDLNTAAAPALSNAQNILTLSRQGAVAESMATRRAVRAGAYDAARNAAETARSASAKAVERSIAYVASAAGLLIAQSGDVIKTGLTTRLLELVFAVIIVTALISLLVDHPGARSIISSFRGDLDRYQEALSKSDIDDLAQAASLRDAEHQLGIAWWATSITYALALCALIAAIYHVIDGNFAALLP